MVDSTGAEDCVGEMDDHAGGEKKLLLLLKQDNQIYYKFPDN